MFFDTYADLCRQKGVSLSRAAEDNGLSRTTVVKWKNGSLPSGATMARLAAYFGVSLDELLGSAGRRKASAAGAQKDYHFANTLERLCLAWNRTPQQVERELPIAHVRLLCLLSADEQPTEEEVTRFAAYFAVPPQLLTPCEPELPQFGREDRNVIPLVGAPGGSRTIPVLGRVPAGVPIEAVEDVIERIDISGKAAASGYEYFGLLVTGNSMYPEYHDGDIVIVRVQSTAETGDDVVAYINGYDATLKRIMITENGLQLRPINPEYETKSFTTREVETLPVTIAGVVVESRRRRK